MKYFDIYLMNYFDIKNKYENKIKNITFITVLFGITACQVYWREHESKLEKTEINNNKTNEETKSLGFEDIYGKTWVNHVDDSTSSELGFYIDGLKDTRGFFEKFDIVFRVADKNHNNAKMKVVIDVGSINTANQTRDEALMGDDFFDYKQYLKINYFSKNVERNDNNYISNGIIEMMGEEHELSFIFKHNDITKNKNNTDIAIFEGELEMDRTKFGMSSTPSVGDIVKLHFYCELIQKYSYFSC